MDHEFLESNSQLFSTQLLFSVRIIWKKWDCYNFECVEIEISFSWNIFSRRFILLRKNALL